MEETNTVTETSAATETQAVEEQPSMGWDNVIAANGVEISFVGMTIVFIGLVLTFCYISLLPKLLNREPRKASEKKPEIAPVATSAEDTSASDIRAAIAYVIAAELEYEKMTDYHKLTIRRDENQQVWGVAGKMRTLATRKISKK